MGDFRDGFLVWIPDKWRKVFVLDLVCVFIIDGDFDWESVLLVKDTVKEATEARLEAQTVH